MAHTIVHCRRCHAELGLTDGQQFIVGACVASGTAAAGVVAAVAGGCGAFAAPLLQATRPVHQSASIPIR